MLWLECRLRSQEDLRAADVSCVWRCEEKEAECRGQCDRATTGMWHHLDVFLMWQHSFHFIVSDFRWCSPPLPPGHVTPQFKRGAMNVSQVRLTWLDYTWVCGQVSLRRRTCVRHMSAGTLQTHKSWCRCKNHWCLEMLSWIWSKPSAVFIFVSFSIFCNRMK